MFLYKISQDVNRGYDTFDSAIVAAPDANSAKMIYPGKGCYDVDAWCDYSYVKVDLIGTTAPGVKMGVILASFNAG